ncbi:MAG TPA: hypothetical protein VLH39_02505 [Magnetospirillaceae bacterium]|nr:hypothetical protein [Magnetospirillaceae bacterium]
MTLCRRAIPGAGRASAWRVLTARLRLRAISALAGLVLVGLVMNACAGGWAPEGSARVLGWHDVERAGIRSCVVFLEVRNDGPVRITRSTISFRVYTASRSYYRTLVLDTHLPSGGILYAESFVEYANPQESAEADGGVALIGCYFE